MHKQTNYEYPKLRNQPFRIITKSLKVLMVAEMLGKYAKAI